MAVLVHSKTVFIDLLHMKRGLFIAAGVTLVGLVGLVYFGVLTFRAGQGGGAGIATFLIFLTVTIGGAGVTWLLWRDHRREAQGIKDACQTIALVTRIEDVRNGYVVHYEFRDVTGFRREGQSTPIDDYPGYNLHPGKPIRVIYSGSRPEWSQIVSLQGGF